LRLRKGKFCWPPQDGVATVTERGKVTPEAAPPASASTMKTSIAPTSAIFFQLPLSGSRMAREYGLPACAACVQAGSLRFLAYRGQQRCRARAGFAALGVPGSLRVLYGVVSAWLEG